MADHDSTRRPFTITLVHRDPEHGFWCARVTNGQGYDVDRSAGSWLADRRTRVGSRTFTRCEVLPHVAAALQQRVRPLERAERQATDAR